MCKCVRSLTLSSVGVAIVGAGDLIFTEEEALNAILGDIFAVSAMVLWAAQLNYEEKFVKKFDIKPMKALGLKGMFSFCQAQLSPSSSSSSAGLLS